VVVLVCVCLVGVVLVWCLPISRNKKYLHNSQGDAWNSPLRLSLTPCFNDYDVIKRGIRDNAQRTKYMAAKSRKIGAVNLWSCKTDRRGSNKRVLGPRRQESGSNPISREKFSKNLSSGGQTLGKKSWLIIRRFKNGRQTTLGRLRKSIDAL